MIKKITLISIISAISAGLLIANVQAPTVPKTGWSHGGLRRQGSNTDAFSGSTSIPSSTVSGGYVSGSIIPDTRIVAPVIVLFALIVTIGLIYFASRSKRILSK